MCSGPWEPKAATGLGKPGDNDAGDGGRAARNLNSAAWSAGVTGLRVLGGCEPE